MWYNRNVERSDVMRKWLSMFLKFIVVMASFIGLILVVCDIKVTYVGGWKGMLYFTNQSNLWIGIVCLVGLIIMIMEEIKHKKYIKPWMKIIKLVFTVAITLTGVVYCFLLVPTMSEDPWCLTSVLTHVVVPVFAVADFLVYDVDFSYKYKHSFFALIPPFYYLIFAGIGYIINLDFGLGVNYPYFFLDWGAPVGFFGISKELPHYIGMFYWLILMLGIVLGFGIFYVKASKIVNKNRK